MAGKLSGRRRVFGEVEKRAYVAGQAASGKTQSAFCRDEGISLASFQNWKRRFAGKSSFIEIATPVQTPVVPVEIVLASGVRIATSSTCDPTWLSNFVCLLGGASC